MPNWSIPFPVLTIGCCSPDTTGLCPDTSSHMVDREPRPSLAHFTPTLTYEYQCMLNSSPVGPSQTQSPPMVREITAMFSPRQLQLLVLAFTDGESQPSRGVPLAPQLGLFPTAVLVHAKGGGCSHGGLTYSSADSAPRPDSLMYLLTSWPSLIAPVSFSYASVGFHVVATSFPLVFLVIASLGDVR